MENEVITLVQPEDDQVATPIEDVASPAEAAADCAEEPNSATICTDGEGLSVCNCENQEEVTVFETDDAIDTEESAFCESPSVANCIMNVASEKIAQKCVELKSTIGDTVSRLARDWKATNGNPYIKCTRTTQVDVYRSPDDTEPVDTFRAQRVDAFSARTLAITSAATFLVSATAESLIRNLFKKK